MRNIPLTVALAWPTPNYTNPETRGSALLVVNIIFVTLVIIAVLGRFYSRVKVYKWLGVDDSMIGLALLFTLGMTAVVILANRNYGWNRHAWDVPLDMLKDANIIAFVAKLMFTLAATFTRLSLLCFYYRLVGNSGNRGFTWILHCSTTFVISVCIVFVFQTVFLCVPVQAYWDYKLSTEGRCLDEGIVTLVAGIINCVADLLTTTLPIPIIWGLKMPLKRRIGICVLLCMGFLVTTAGAIRTYFIWKSLVDSWDETWFSYPLWIAAAVEIDLAVICACAPSWKILLDKPITRVTSKIASLRCRHGPERTPDSSASGGKLAMLNPLQRLPWFQFRRLRFASNPHPPLSAIKQQQCRDPYAVSTSDIEKGRPDLIDSAIDEAANPRPSADDLGARDFRHSEIAFNDADDLHNEDERDLYPGCTPLRIMLRQSIEQNSAMPADVPPISSTPARRSIGNLLPGQWFGDGSDRSKSVSPRR